MRFHFRHHDDDRRGPERPSAILVVSSAPASPRSPVPHDEDLGTIASPPRSPAASKDGKGLPPECPASDPSHARPRPRRFLRLGRGRRDLPPSLPTSLGEGCAVCAGSITSDSSDDELTKSERARRRKARANAKARALPKPRPRGVVKIGGPTRGGRSPGSPPRHPDKEETGPLPSPGVEAMRSRDDPDPAAGAVDPREGPAPASVPPPGPQPRRRVTFGAVSTRQYCTVLGDHPCCPAGPPLSLGWTVERDDISGGIDAYEAARVPTRRGRDGIKLGVEVRREILRSLTRPCGPSPPTSPGANSRNSGEGEGEGDGTEAGRRPLYTGAELRRAERRLARERAANGKMCSRMNRRFFKPLTDEEYAISGRAFRAMGEADVTSDSETACRESESEAESSSEEAETEEGVAP